MAHINSPERPSVRPCGADNDDRKTDGGLSERRRPQVCWRWAAMPSAGWAYYGHLRRCCLVAGEEEGGDACRSQWRRFALEIAAQRLLLLTMLYHPPHQSLHGDDNSTIVT